MVVDSIKAKLNSYVKTEKGKSLKMYRRKVDETKDRNVQL